MTSPVWAFTVPLPREPEQHRLLVLAHHATRFVVRARAGLLDDVNEVRGDVRVRRLRRDDVASAKLADATEPGDLATTLLARRRQRQKLSRSCNSCHRVYMGIKTLQRKRLDVDLFMPMITP